MFEFIYYYYYIYIYIYIYINKCINVMLINSYKIYVTKLYNSMEINVKY